MENMLYKRYSKSWERAYEQLLWENRRIYIDLLEEYLSFKIDGKEVINKFFHLYLNYNEEIHEFLLDPERFKKVQIDSKSEGFEKLLTYIFDMFEALDLEETDDNAGYPMSENLFQKNISLSLQELKDYD